VVAQMLARDVSHDPPTGGGSHRSR
jgi:hypothetical protein